MSRKRTSGGNPLLRYFGGKWRIADWIIDHFPAHDVYIEPFGGGASVFLKKSPSKVEIYNDIDQEITHVFRVLRDPSLWPELERRMRLTPYARAEFERQWDEPTDDVDRALKVLVRSRMGFGVNAIWDRATSMRIRRDERSTPAHEWANLWSQVGTWAQRFSNVVVEGLPALDIISTYDGVDHLFYVDPPYVHSSRGKRNRYRHELTDEDHRELAIRLRGVKGMVVLSGYRCDLYDELFGDWERIDRDHLADGARKRTESLWLSPRTAAVLHPRLIAAS